MKEINKKTKCRVLLLDMFNITIGMHSNMNIINSNMEQVGMFLGTCNMIRSFADKLKPSKIFCCYDGPEAGARRRGIQKDYKDKRRVKLRVSTVKLYEENFKSSEYTERDGFQRQLAQIYEFSKLLPISNVVVPYCEGDDVIAHLALSMQEEYEILIVSADKDYMQLINENIKVYNWRKKKIYNRETFLEEYKILSENYIFMKILLGDVSDRVEGVKGIGPKTISNLYSFFNERVYEDLTDMIVELKKLDLEQFDTRTKNSISKMLTEDVIKKMSIAYRLMKLDMDCLSLHHKEILTTQIEEQKDRKLSRMQGMLYLQRNEFNRLYNGFNVTNWLSPFNMVNR